MIVIASQEASSNASVQRGGDGGLAERTPLVQAGWVPMGFFIWLFLVFFSSSMPLMFPSYSPHPPPNTPSPLSLSLSVP